MKLDVITKTDGNLVVRSTWIDNPKGAVKAFHHWLDILSGDPDTQIGWVAIFNEELDIFENYRECVSNVVPAPTTYTVVFNSYGGSEIESQTVVKGESAIQPEDPIREGYTFIKWELNGYDFSFDTPINENITLVARWAEAQPEDPTPSEPQPEE